MWGEGGMRENRADPAPCPLFRAAVPIPVSGPPFPVRDVRYGKYYLRYCGR